MLKNECQQGHSRVSASPWWSNRFPETLAKFLSTVLINVGVCWPHGVCSLREKCSNCGDYVLLAWFPALHFVFLGCQKGLLSENRSSASPTFELFGQSCPCGQWAQFRVLHFNSQKLTKNLVHLVAESVIIFTQSWIAGVYRGVFACGSAGEGLR